MKRTNATKFHRKSRVAERRDLRFSGLVLDIFFDRGSHGPSATQEDEKRATKVCLALYQGTTLVVP
jgi:hypothetical protein